LDHTAHRGYRCAALGVSLALLPMLPLLAGCSGSSESATSGIDFNQGSTAGASGGGAEGYDFHLPKGFPKPKVPADNPMSAAKVELGRRLFYDKRLSGNQTYACASCHRQQLAFTDGLAHAEGSTGQMHPRGSMSLANIAYAAVLTWANPLIDTLEDQALLPMFGETPVELGLAGKENVLFARIEADPLYRDLFARAFPDERETIALKTITRAIAAFERSLLSGRSAYDRFATGEDGGALGAAALRGRTLYFSEKLECFHCHGGFNFADSTIHEGSALHEVMFHNTGLYNIDGKGAYPTDNTGVYAVTGVATDMGRFRAPTLRNIAVTAPYMHDGSVATLDEALDHYAAGGRTLTAGPNAGAGSENPYKSELITGFKLSPDDKADVIAFLKSLTDEAFLTDPRFADPWAKSP
jgi:cytochrome c peroxidase